MAELWILIVLVVIVGLSVELKLSRANRIARANHDLLKAILEHSVNRESASRGSGAKPPPIPVAASEVYRID